MNRPSFIPTNNKQSNKMINDNLKSEMIRHFMSQVKTEDLLNVAFMKPLEVALRTNKTDKAVPADALPSGLMLVIKQNGINDNKYKLQTFKPVTPDITSLDALKEKHMDNYISLLKKCEDEQPADLKQQYVDQVRMSQAQQARKEEKKKHKGHEFGICVSMCKQDKKTLKKTLIGVSQNVDELVRSGVCPDDIFVVVMIDGVQNVDKSLYQYFEEFERESQTFLEEDDVLTMKKKYENYLYHQEIQKQQPLNFTKFLFKPQEFANRIESKFPHVRAKYDEVIRIKKSIQNIKKQNNKDNDNLKMILNKMIDKQKDILKKIKSQKKVLINEQSIMKELANSQEECTQYLTTRDSLAYVCAYRLRTSSLCTDLQDLQTKQTIERSSMIEGQFETERMYDEELMQKSREESGLTENRLIKKTIKYVNLFFCIKYKQTGKLSSHNWFFNGFCQQLKPKYTVILDVGVRPYPDAIFKMYRCMKLNDRVGSVCGYMRLIEQKVEDQQMNKPQDMDCISSTLVNVFDIQRAQQIHKHFQHLVEKPFQSVFKFIHVLPGAFSAYNMEALRPMGENDQLLREYFRSMDEKLSTNKVIPSVLTGRQILARVLLPKTLWKLTNNLDPDSQQQLLYSENVNLAQDRILCLGIHKNDKDIVFMPDVYAQVQPIKMINNLMGEKKREINGGAYSFEKVRKQFARQDSQGSVFLIRFQLLYLSFNKFISYFAPALLIFILQFTFQIIQTQFLADLFAKQSKTGIGNVLYGTITNIIVFFLALLMFTILFYSLHLDYKSKKFMYYAYLVTSLMGIFSMTSFIVFLAQTIQGFVGSGDYLRKSYFIAVESVIPGKGLLFVNGLRYFIGGAVFVIIFPIIIYSIFFRKFGILWDILVGSISYIFYFPTYAVVMPIYAKCRLDDISSATVSNLGSRTQKLKQTWKILKLIYVFKYFFWNAIVAVILIILNGYLLIKFFSLLFFLMLFTIMELAKLIPVLMYTISYKCKMFSNPLKPSDKQVEQNSLNNEFRVFNAIKRLQQDLRIQIQYSFELASEDLEYQQQLKKETQLQKQQVKKNEKNEKATPKPKRLESQYHLSRQSIKIMNNFQGNKFTNIRQSSAIKGSYYPMQFGKKQQVGPSIAQTTVSPAPLQMVLLKQQIGQQALGNTQMKAGEQKLKQFQIFRGTMARPVIKN